MKIVNLNCANCLEMQLFLKLINFFPLRYYSKLFLSWALRKICYDDTDKEKHRMKTLSHSKTIKLSRLAIKRQKFDEDFKLRGTISRGSRR